MKKLLSILLIIILSSCSLDRNLYYNFQFDDYSIVVGYDDLEYINLVFTNDVQSELEAKQEIENIPLYYWGNYFGDIDIINNRNRKIDSKKAIVTRLNIYFSNLEMQEYKIDGITLVSSVKENCEIFSGNYLENNGYGCVFGKKVGNNYNYIVLSGDYLNIDQDELSRIEIYVK